MTQPTALSAALALGWSLLLTLGLVTIGILVGALFGSGNLAIVMAGPAELLLMLPAALLLVQLYGGADRRRALALAPASGLELVIGASLGVILHLPTGYLSELVERRFPTPRAVLEAQLHALTPGSSAMAILMLLSVAALVPVAEELFFRGALFTPLLRSAPGFVATWTTSVGFALAHQEPRNWAPLLLVALVLAELRQLGGSIWPGVALHAAFNAATLLMVFVERPVEIKPQAGSWLLALMGGLLTLGGVWLFARVAGRRQGAVSLR
jgi:membrane protease YdiL (CAAX protease family)